MRRNGGVLIRNVILGVEDSLVSTVGLLSGLAATGESSRALILLTGVIYISVEAFSMAIGSFLSEETAEEYAHKRPRLKVPFLGAVIMFFSFFFAGLIPIIPYLLFLEREAIWVSVAASVIALFIVGVLSGRFVHTRPLWHGVRMALLGGFAIGIGILVGNFVEIE